jgi:hypothetical protein
MEAVNNDTKKTSGKPTTKQALPTLFFFMSQPPKSVSPSA